MFSTKPFLCRFLASIAFLMIAMVVPSGSQSMLQAQTPLPLTDVQFQVAQEPQPELLARVRLPAGAELAKVEVKAGEKSVEGASFGPQEGKPEESSIVLVLFDDSQSMKKALPRIQRFLLNLSQRVAETKQPVLLGLASFSDQLSLISPPAKDLAGFNQAVNQLSAEGRSTETYRSLLSAIEELGKIEGRDRTILLLTDGKAEDTQYTREEVAKAAREAGITIHGLGVPMNINEIGLLQTNTWLAEQTGGIELRAGDRDQEFPQPEIARLLHRLTGATLVRIPLVEVTPPVEITLTLTDQRNQIYTTTYTLEQGPSPAPTPAPEITEDKTESKESTATQPPSEPEVPANGVKKIQTVIEKLDQPSRIALTAGIVLVLGLILWLLKRLLFPSSKPEAPTGGGIPDTGSNDHLGWDDGPPLTEGDRPESPLVAYGWLIAMDADQTRYPISKKAFRMGRSPENDLVLANRSISMHHAEILISRDGEISITDLRSHNGFRVNGQRITQAILRDGDILELAEVRFRFEANPTHD